MRLAVIGVLLGVILAANGQGYGRNGGFGSYFQNGGGDDSGSGGFMGSGGFGSGNGFGSGESGFGSGGGGGGGFGSGESGFGSGGGFGGSGESGFGGSGESGYAAGMPAVGGGYGPGYAPEEPNEQEPDEGTGGRSSEGPGGINLDSMKYFKIYEDAHKNGFRGFGRGFDDGGSGDGAAGRGEDPEGGYGYSRGAAAGSGASGAGGAGGFGAIRNGYGAGGEEMDDGRDNAAAYFD